MASMFWAIMVPRRCVRSAMLAGLVLSLAVGSGGTGEAGAAENAILVASVDSPTYHGILGIGPYDGFSMGSTGSLLVYATTAGLWTTDGTDAGALIVSEYGSSVIASGEGIVLLGNLPDPEELPTLVRRSDGTADGTVPLVTLDRGVPFWLVGRELFFDVTQPRYSPLPPGLWVSDPTSPEPIMLTEEGLVGGFVEARGRVYFTATSAATLLDRRVVLEKTDGTARGTSVVRTIASGAVCSSTVYAAGGTLFVLVTESPDCTGPVRVSLVATEGSVGRPQLLVEWSGGPSVRPAVLRGMLLFQGPTGLWRSDGSKAGTVEVAPIVPYRIVTLGDVAIFGGVDADGDAGLWVTDGTPAGTMLLAAGPQDEIATIRRSVFFTDGGRRELWRTDGTQAGTRRVDVELGGGVIGLPQNVHGTLMFTTDDGNGSNGAPPTNRRIWALADCQSDADCDDDDACTRDTCREGLCFVERLDPGDLAACRVTDLVTRPLCRDAADARRLRLGRVRARVARLLDRGTRTSGSVKGERRLGRAQHLLASLAQNADRLARHGRVEPACANAVGGRAWEERALIGDVSSGRR